MESRQLCTFFLDDLQLGIEVQRVQEVLRHPEVTRVPLAPPVISGLVNLRGQIVTAIDLRCRLGMPMRPQDLRPMNVVISLDEGPISLLVDRIGDVIEVDEGRLEPPPDTLSGVARELVRGIYKLEDRILVILDTDRTAAVV